VWVGCTAQRGRGDLSLAFDESLADRVRDVLAARGDLSERKMFGGIAFMIGGNMAVGVIGDDLMVRLDPTDAEQALKEPHTRPMDFTGRPMKGMIFVESPGTEANEDLAGWVEAGADFAASLPPK
jgi:TfoX/Sxy family transcriptional regulator of competence genes